MHIALGKDPWKIRTAKIILYNKGTFRGITIPDIKVYYRVTVMKELGIIIKREVNQWNQIKDPDIDTHNYESPIFDKEAKIIQLKKKHLQQMVLS